MTKQRGWYRDYHFHVLGFDFWITIQKTDTVIIIPVEIEE